MTSILNTIAGWFYPECCPICHRVLKRKKDKVCPECRSKVKPISQPYCMKCGKPVSMNMELCGDCRYTLSRFDRGRGVFLYNETWKESVLLFKNAGRRQYGDFYAAAMWHYARDNIKMWKPDMIVPVPLSARKKRQRGFNQAEYLAKNLSMYSGIPCHEKCLLKIKETRQQKTLNRVQRKRNLNGAYIVTEQLTGKSILLVDDVYTTGSTMDTLAECLKKAGASRVYFLTLCIGNGE